MTARILSHPTRFDGDARIRLANMRLMNAMQKVQSNLEQFVQERDWSIELDRIYQEACAVEDRSIALAKIAQLSEPPKAG